MGKTVGEDPSTGVVDSRLGWVGSEVMGVDGETLPSPEEYMGEYERRSDF